MKLSIIKNIFKSFLFLLKHIILAILINTIFYYLFNVFLYDILINKLSRPIDNFIRSEYFISSYIFSFFVNTLKIVTISTFYIIAKNNDEMGVENDINMYITEFFSSYFRSIMTSFAFIFISIFSMIGIVTFVFFINLCIFYLPFVLVRVLEIGKKYSTIDGIYESFKLTKTFRLKLIFFNTIIFSSVVFLILRIPNELYYENINISYYLKTILINLIIVYIITTFFELEKLKNIVLEKIKSKEIENSYNKMRARSSITTVK